MANPNCNCYYDKTWDEKGYDVNCVQHNVKVEVGFKNRNGVTFVNHDNETYWCRVNYCPMCGKKMKDAERGDE